jgi:hypothetical protein
VASYVKRLARKSACYYIHSAEPSVVRVQIANVVFNKRVVKVSSVCLARGLVNLVGPRKTISRVLKRKANTAQTGENCRLSARNDYR